MTKQKIVGILESESVLLEPVSEMRYRLLGEIDCAHVGSWVTVAGDIAATTVTNAAVVTVEKNSGKSTRAGVIVITAPNLPPEANGAGGYLYQSKKGRYFLLSSGAPGEPVQGDFSAYVDQDVKVSGELKGSSYILYNVKIAMK